MDIFGFLLFLRILLYPAISLAFLTLAYSNCGNPPRKGRSFWLFVLLAIFYLFLMSEDLLLLLGNGLIQSHHFRNIVETPLNLILCIYVWQTAVKLANRASTQIKNGG